MEELTFGEQVKIVLGRKGMTIKELAELIEAQTGKKMSRQNLTQRLGRDNFQEQDMRMIAQILECPFHLSILSGEAASAARPADTERGAAKPMDAKKGTANSPDIEKRETDFGLEKKSLADGPREMAEESASDSKEERDMTIGELYEIHQELSELEKAAQAGESEEAIKEEIKSPKKEKFSTGGIFFRKKEAAARTEEKSADGGKPETESLYAAEPASVKEETAKAEEAKRTEDKIRADKEEDFEPVIRHNDAEEDRERGEINPYTGREYQSNSVRMHPTRIGYVQVYDRKIHKWTDMTEWAFLGYQERMKALLGKAYEPPIYLD